MVPRVAHEYKNAQSRDCDQGDDGGKDGIGDVACYKELSQLVTRSIDSVHSLSSLAMMLCKKSREPVHSSATDHPSSMMGLTDGQRKLQGRARSETIPLR